MSEQPLRIRTLRRADVIIEVIGAVLLFAFLLALHGHFGSLRSYLFFALGYAIVMAVLRRILLRLS